MIGEGSTDFSDKFAERGHRIDDLVKKRLSEMQTNLSVDEILAVADLVKDDPMLESLIQVDQGSWQVLYTLFTEYSKGSKALQSQAEGQPMDPIVKGKYQSLLLRKTNMKICLTLYVFVWLTD